MRAARVALVAALALAGLAALASPAAAQDGICQAPEVTVGDVGGPFGPGETRPILVTVSNPNGGDATADVTVTTPDGWDGGDGQSGVDVPAGGATEVELTLTAPQEGGSGGDLDVEATLTCQPLGATSGSSSDSAQLAYEAPGLPWAWIVAGVVGLTAAGGGVAAYRRRPQGLEADCPQPVQEAAPGGRASFDLAVENPRDTPDTARIDVRDPPPGWKAFATVEEVELGATEVRNPSVAVVVPDGAEDGESVRLAVEVASGRSGESTAVPLRVDVAGDDGGRSGPPDDGV